MIVALRTEYDADIAYIPDICSEKIESYYDAFLKWLYDKKTDHKYWVYRNGRKYGVSYSGDAFVYWLNRFILMDSDDQAKIIQESTNDYDRSMTTLYF